MQPSSQQNIDEFWKSLATQNAGARASSILPPSYTAKRIPKPLPSKTVQSENALLSYKAAVEECQAKVDRIVRECRRVNQKYSDASFDLDKSEDALNQLRGPPRRPVPPPGRMLREITLDFGRNDRAILRGEIELPPDSADSQDGPAAVKRVPDIFDKPQFYVDGTNAKDIRQGREGDCWFLSSLAALCAYAKNKHLIEKICVRQDAAVGVYGFVFHRDGEWISEVIDDKLFLTKPDYDEVEDEDRERWDDRIRVNSAEEWERAFQSNSGALFFAQCADDNETWVPLIEKAYAKAHGDYGAIAGGWTAEGIEDLTGGVTTEVGTTMILDKDKYWNDCLMKVGQEFLFGCETESHRNQSDLARQGITDAHAYSILDAKEIDGFRLVKVKNPWGRKEWTGAWSDGSSQWTAEWLGKLCHTFGDDGIFWISYKDLLRKFSTIQQTRIFDENWRVVRLWANLRVPWASDFHETRFDLTLPQEARTVLVLSQLDTRYFKGLEGKYDFRLSFRLYKNGEQGHLVETIGERWFRRSTSVEIELEPGTYSVVVKIAADYDPNAAKIEDVVRMNWLKRRDKLLSVGLSYDLAHARGRYQEDPSTTMPPIRNESARERFMSRSVSPVLPPFEFGSRGPSPQPEMEIGSEERRFVLVEEPPVDARGLGPPSPRDNIVLDRLRNPIDRRVVLEGDNGERSEDDNDERVVIVQSKDPGTWDATCIVGLRVYTRHVDSELTLVTPERRPKASRSGSHRSEDEVHTDRPDQAERHFASKLKKLMRKNQATNQTEGLIQPANSI